MNGQDILNQAAAIIKRQDIDRPLLLFFINAARRAVLRDRKIRRFNKLVAGVPHAGGVIDMTAQKIKNPRVVEWQHEDAGAKRVPLSEVYTYQQAMDIYGALTTPGSPTGYLEMGTLLYILPAPLAGQINIYGEFWPDDITDAPSSADVTTVEIPDALVFLGTAEYLDFLAEPDKAQYWRGRGMSIVDQYIRQWNAQEYDTTDAWRRAPFGKAPQGRRACTAADLNRGSW